VLTCYLSSEFILYLTTPLFLLTLQWNRRVGYSLLCVGSLGSVGVNAYLAVIYDFVSSGKGNVSPWRVVYANPLCKAGSTSWDDSRHLVEQRGNFLALKELADGWLCTRTRRPLYCGHLQGNSRIVTHIIDFNPSRSCPTMNLYIAIEVKWGNAGVAHRVK